MSGTPEDEATNPDRRPTNKDGKTNSLNVDDLEGNELVREVYRNIDKRLSKIESQLQEKDVTVQSRNSKILDKYQDKKKKKLVATAFNRGNEGLEREWLEKNFNVDEDQARKIMKKAGQQYDYLEWNYPGGPIAGKLYHVVSREADNLADLLGIEPKDDGVSEKSPRQQVLDNAEWSGDFESTEVLKDLRNEKQEIENQNKKKESYNETKKRIGSIL